MLIFWNFECIKTEEHEVLGFVYQVKIHYDVRITSTEAKILF